MTLFALGTFFEPSRTHAHTTEPLEARDKTTGVTLGRREVGKSSSKGTGSLVLCEVLYCYYCPSDDPGFSLL